MAPWLLNLLPEGNALNVMSRLTGTAPEDVVSVLMQVGRDTAGALSIGESRPASSADAYIEMSDKDLERVFEDLPRRPFLVGEDGVSMSLAGAQEKLPVIKTDGGLGIPIDGAPSTHILKPDNKALYGSVQNEALCMTLARLIGLPTAEVATGTAGQRAYLLVTRYDRFQQNGRWRRRHQEDFCQALGKPPGAKYQHNKTGTRGPTLPDLFDLVRKAMTAQAVIHLTDAIVFNVLITNVDSHAKNYSLMLSGRGASLAHLYDLMCGAAWPDVTRNMAQDIGGQEPWRAYSRATLGADGAGLRAQHTRLVTSGRQPRKEGHCRVVCGPERRAGYARGRSSHVARFRESYRGQMCNRRG